MRNQITNRIKEQASLFPEKVLFQSLSDLSITYQEQVNILDDFKEFFKDSELSVDTRISIFTYNEILTLCFAIAIVEHCTLVPLDNDLPEKNYYELFELYHTQYILVEDVNLPIITFAISQDLGIIHAEKVGSRYKFKIVKLTQKFLPEHLIGKNTATIARSSGTTGVPKLIPSSYDRLVNRLKDRENRLTYDHNTVSLRIVKTTRLGPVNEAIRIAVNGSSGYFSNGLKINEIIELINNDKISNMSLPPASLLSLMDYMDSHNITTTNKKSIYISLVGSYIPFEKILYAEKIFNAEVIYNYGMTEGGGATTYKAPLGKKKDSVGIPNCEIKFLNGEILVKGPRLFEGYENVPNDETVFIDGWYRTGDTGYLDEDGYLLLQVE